MTKTEKSNTRKGPPESATAFSVGTIKKGNDGNMWKIIITATGIHRWSIIKGNNSVTKKNKTVKNKTVNKVKESTQPSRKIFRSRNLKILLQNIAY